MNVKSIARGIAVAGTVALSLTIVACGSGTDDADTTAADQTVSSESTADGENGGQDAGESRAPGSAAATSTPETEMPEAEEAGPHNDADIAFNRMMMTHHQQAVTMVGLIDGRTDNADIIELGKKIAKAQSREIEQMSARLAAWGEDPTAPSVHEPHDGHQGHGESGEDMQGMLSDEAMQQLAEAQGPEFDRLFLEGMIEHHEGAVAMAEDVIRDGENEPTRELAENVVDSQKEEIDEMKKLLGA